MCKFCFINVYSVVHYSRETILYGEVTQTYKFYYFNFLAWRLYRKRIFPNKSPFYSSLNCNIIEVMKNILILCYTIHLIGIFKNFIYMYMVYLSLLYTSKREYILPVYELYKLRTLISFQSNISHHGQIMLQSDSSIFLHGDISQLSDINKLPPPCKSQKATGINMLNLENITLLYTD